MKEETTPATNLKLEPKPEPEYYRHPDIPQFTVMVLTDDKAVKVTNIGLSFQTIDLWRRQRLFVEDVRKNYTPISAEEFWQAYNEVMNVITAQVGRVADV